MSSIYSPNPTQPISAKPDLNRIQEQFLWSVNRQHSSIFNRQRLATRARNCWWPGQTTDGRKWWKLENEQDTFPWSGSSDMRPHFVDTYIREDVALLMRIWRQNKIRVLGAESQDDAFAWRLSNMLRWLKYMRMANAARETRLVANWMLERGSAVMGTFWKRETQLGYDTIDMETIRTIAMDAQTQMASGTNQVMVPGVANEELAELPMIIADPTRSKDALRIAEAIYPDASGRAMRQALRDLNESGVARLPRPFIIYDLPKLTAFSVNEDLFIPPEASDLQAASGIFWREVLTDVALREREHSHGWDKKWIEQVIKTQRGRMTASLGGQSLTRSVAISGSTRQSVDTTNLYEIIHAYHRESDENGVPGIFVTVYSPGLISATSSRCDAYASHELLNYDHGQYPFTLFETETRSRVVDDARGYGEVMSTWQDGIKAEIDMRRDRSSLATLPPSFHPVGQQPDRWGPGVQLGTSQPQGYGFVDIPRFDPGSKEVETTIRHIADRWVGRPLPDGSNQLAAGNLMQDLADGWLEAHTKVDTQILQLCQQFMPDQFFMTVTGEKGRPVHATRDEIQGEFHVRLSYSTGDQVPDVIKEQIALMREAISLDRSGRVDSSEAVQVAFEKIAPDLGERLLMPKQAASESEIKEEADAFAQMFAGVDVDVKPGGSQNYQLRLQWLVQQMHQNPDAQQRYAQSAHFRDLVNKRMKQLKFQLDEYTVNAQQGRLGA